MNVDLGSNRALFGGKAKDGEPGNCGAFNLQDVTDFVIDVFDYCAGGVYGFCQLAGFVVDVLKGFRLCKGEQGYCQNTSTEPTDQFIHTLISKLCMNYLYELNDTEIIVMDIVLALHHHRSVQTKNIPGLLVESLGPE